MGVMDNENSPQITEIASQLANLMSESGTGEQSLLREELSLAQRQIQRLQLEDEGWQLLTGGQRRQEGATLEQMKKMSRLLRAAVAESPLPKQADSLRSSYTFSEPFLIPALEQAQASPEVQGPKKRGPKSEDQKSVAALQKFVDSRPAREFIFGKQAQELISRACSTDGLYLLVGNNSTKNVNAIQLDEIVAVLEDPDFPGEVWAYQRQWEGLNSKGESETKKKWYYTDRFEGQRPKSIGTGADKVEVDIQSTIFDLRVNTQVGWAFGTPDLWAGHVWNRNYLQAMKDGLEVTDLMAWLTAKVKTQNKKGSDAVGVRSKQGGPGGSLQTYGLGNSIDTYATTGKAYEFDQLRPLAAVYALAAGVSVVDLLASPSAAGASYGSAQALAPGMRRAISVRRDQIAAWRERVLQWATGTYYHVTPASIEEVEPYRAMQMTQLAHLTGLFHDDEIRPRMAYLAGVTLKHPDKPEGYLVPNNKDSLPRKDIDTDSSGPTKTSPSPDQGKDNGTGGAPSGDKNDLRDDNIS